MLDSKGVAGAVAISGGVGFVGAASGGMVAVTGATELFLIVVVLCSSV